MKEFELGHVVGLFSKNQNKEVSLFLLDLCEQLKTSLGHRSLQIVRPFSHMVHFLQAHHHNIRGDIVHESQESLNRDPACRWRWGAIRIEGQNGDSDWVKGAVFYVLDVVEDVVGEITGLGVLASGS